MLKAKIVSSLEKALLEDNIDSYEPLLRISALRGERLSLQLLHTFEYEDDMPLVERNRAFSHLTVEGEIAKYVTVSDVDHVPVSRPTLGKVDKDQNYISFRPGLFPDVIRPLHYNGGVISAPYLLSSLWVEIEIPDTLSGGEYELSFTLDAEEKGSAKASVVIEVINATLPEGDMYFTQWFHADCLASYYNLEVFSERHWQIIENFVKVAARNGINMLLTPVFTPPLDTAPGGERPTVQLVGVTLSGGEYFFDFSLFDRWVGMCKRLGIKYIEISHLFTQWGAYHAPKIMATVDGEYKRIFGWDTEASGEEYTRFLRLFISELLSHASLIGIEDSLFFHISDEPREEHLESYKAAKAVLSDLLSGHTIMDALSSYKFWQEGLVETPIPASNHIAPFIEGGVPNLWTYYCCTQVERVSNRFIEMGSYRNRSIGFQMYKYSIVGFLHWGYNFYYNWHSADLINPYLMADGDGWVSPGDAFSVYPAPSGEAYESVRLKVFYDALTDIRAMKLCETLVGREAVVRLIDETLGEPVTFDTCAKNAKTVLTLREGINRLIKENLK